MYQSLLNRNVPAYRTPYRVLNWMQPENSNDNIVISWYVDRSCGGIATCTCTRTSW